MANSSSNYISNFTFTVTFGPLSLGFSKVSNMESSVDYDTILEGGSNECPIFLEKPKQDPDTIVFERGITTNLKEMVFALITEGMKIKGVTVFVKKNGKTCRIFAFEEGLIISKSFSELNASKPDVFLETLEIAHSGLYEIPVPPIF